MKKILIIPMFAMIVTSAISQITITGVDLPKAGTTYLLGNDTTTAVLLGTPGASWQSWDFSVLNNHYYKIADYDSTANTAFAADFPTSNVDTYGPSMYYSTLYGGAPVDQGSNGYMFWNSGNTGFWAVGFRADDGPYSNNNVHEIPPELLIGAPATYGTVFNNDSRWELSMDLQPGDIDTFFIVNRSKTITVDAWGELITPYGTFSDVIRYDEYFTEQDSVRSEFMAWDSTFFFVADTGHVFTYMANGIGYPLAIIRTDINYNVMTIEYLLDSLFVSLNPVEPTIDFKIYPNPTYGTVTLTTSDNPSNGEFIIFDILGNKVKSVKSINDKSNKIDLVELPTGIYMYRFMDDQGVNVTGRIIKN